MSTPKKEKEKERTEEAKHELESIKYRAFGLAREGICACSTPTSPARREAFRLLKFDLVSAGTASKAAKHIYYLSTAHPSDHYPAMSSPLPAPPAPFGSSPINAKAKERSPFAYNFGMKSKQVNNLLELSSVELVVAVKSLMLEHFARLPRPAVLPACAGMRQEEVENTWFLRHQGHCVARDLDGMDWRAQGDAVG